MDKNTDDWDDSVSHPIYPKTCDFWIKENTKFYVGILKIIKPYIEDFITVLEGEGAESYYSRKELHTKKEIEEIYSILINETYGHK